MKVNNAVYRPIKIKQADLPIKAGTPLDKWGNECNGAGAIGLCPQTVDVAPTGEILVLIGGSVELAEVEAEYGALLNAAAVIDMDGISFVTAKGQSQGYQLPACTAGTLGGVKFGGAVAHTGGTYPSKAQFNALVDALVTAGIIALSEA